MIRATWHKSSYSSDQGGQCIEIAGLDGDGRAVRDSKDSTGPALVLGAAQWAVFAAGVRAGEFG